VGVAQRLELAGGQASASSQLASRKVSRQSASRGGIASPSLGTPGLRISGTVRRCRVVHVVEAEAALDAQAAVVGRPVASLDSHDLVVRTL
jgi:hypothetical protein